MMVRSGTGRARDRVLGRVEGAEPGPLLICIGGLHGNEPAGVLALERVIPLLDARRDRMRGDFVALLGNREALAVGRRYLARDLNRAWTPVHLERLRKVNGQGQASAEDREQAELQEALAGTLAEARGPVHVVDLHTTSGAGGAFALVSDTLVNRAFALAIPVPLILGLEELVDGTLLGYLNELGVVALGFESGQHGEDEAVDRAEAAVLIAVTRAGLLDDSDLPEATQARRRLAGEFRHLPPVLEMRYRHPIGPEDGFRMRPGYRNFQPVARGEVLAQDARGAVRSPETGRMLMPLYQEQGEDGFFVIREFRTFWLGVSRILRRLGAAQVVHWLPGVHRHPTLPGALVANRRVARWYALELFHLLGYRKHLEDGDRLVVVRRRQPAGS